jgi:membrane associated rhomboid family serine protease
MTLIEQLKYQYRTGGVYLRLIYINIGVYLVFALILVFMTLMKWDNSANTFTEFKNIFSFHSNLIEFITKPWGIITYMFIHGSFFHLFSNMLILFFAGKMYENFLGPKKTLSTFFIGGVSGALFYLITHNIFPLFRDINDISIVGASAAVMAIFVGLATYSPNFEVMLFGVFKVKMKYLAIVWVALDITGLANNDGVAHFAHIGGALWGYIFITNLKKGKDLSSWFEKMSLSFKNLFKKNKIKIVYSKGKKTASKRSTSDYNYNHDKKIRQNKVDAILDKIKASGYESLSKEEKDYLFDASKNI